MEFETAAMAAISCRLLPCLRNAQPQPQHQGMIFDGIPCERAEDEAFWTTMVTACLISSEKVGAQLAANCWRAERVEEKHEKRQFLHLSLLNPT